MGLFSSLRAWLDWRRRDREETFVASVRYVTNWVNDDRTPTGDATVMICSFYVDGNGVRYCRLDRPRTASGDAAEQNHSVLREDKHNWRYFGALPQAARRPDPAPRGKLVVLPPRGQS